VVCKFGWISFNIAMADLTQNTWIIQKIQKATVYY